MKIERKGFAGELRNAFAQISTRNLDDDELGHVINKYHSWLKEKHAQNTCRNLVNASIQDPKHLGKNPKHKKSLGMCRTVLATRDHLTTIGEVQQLEKVSGLGEKSCLKLS